MDNALLCLEQNTVLCTMTVLFFFFFQHLSGMGKLIFLHHVCRKRGNNYISCHTPPIKPIKPISLHLSSSTTDNYKCSFPIALLFSKSLNPVRAKKTCTHHVTLQLQKGWTIYIFLIWRIRRVLSP